MTMKEASNYITPETEVIELKLECIICESPGGGGTENPNPGMGF